MTKKRKAASSAGRKRKNYDDDDSDFSVTDIDDEESEEEEYDEDIDEADEADDDESNYEDTGTTQKRKRAGGGGDGKKKQGAAKKATITGRPAAIAPIPASAVAAAGNSTTNVGSNDDDNSVDGDASNPTEKKKNKKSIKKNKVGASFSTIEWRLHGANANLCYDNKFQEKPNKYVIKEHWHQKMNPIQCTRRSGKWNCTKLPKTATSQIEKKQREYNAACIERGEHPTIKATYFNTTLKTVHFINRAAIVDLIVYDKDSNFTQTLINDLVKVTRNKALTITSLLKTTLDGSFDDNIGQKLLDDHDYSPEKIKKLKTLLVSLDNSTDPKLKERLRQYSTGNYENYIFGMTCDNCSAIQKRSKVEYKDLTDEQKATHTATSNAAGKKRKVVQAEALQQVMPEGTGVCDRCSDPFNPYDIRIIGTDKTVCEPCNRDRIIKNVKRNRVKVEEKIKQLNACQDVSYHNLVILFL